MAMLKKLSIKKLIIVDDDEILQSFLYRYLTKKHYSTECLQNGTQLPSLLDKTRADLIVLDVKLPSKEGFYWLKWLQQYHPHIPVIIASVKSDEHERLAGLEEGARDYVIKPFQCKELLIRIENILGSSVQPECEKFIQIGEWQLDIQACTVTNGMDEVKLTALEASILRLLYINKGAPVSRDEIMAQIKGVEYNPLDRSIDIHINKLRKKIETKPAAPAYICTVRGKGYRLHTPTLAT